MYKCEICNKEFEKIMAFTGHKAWHVKRSGLDKLAAKSRGLKIVKRNEEKYLINPLKCKSCNKIIPYNKVTAKRSELKKGAKHVFCNQSCSASYNNANRIISSKTKEKISQTLSKVLKLKSNKKSKNIDLICPMCSVSFSCTKSKYRKTCSDECRRMSFSKNRQNYLIKNGNFSTPRERFIYKDVDIEVDSNLEKAGIIYLVDHLNAVFIERFNSILNYNDGIKNRTYNPDFICCVGDQTYIIEIKQKWYSSSEHIYNISIPYKKKALEDFCSQRGYKHLWIDFDTTPLLRRIYNNVLRERNAPPKGFEPLTTPLH